MIDQRAGHDRKIGIREPRKGGQQDLLLLAEVLTAIALPIAQKGSASRFGVLGDRPLQAPRDYQRSVMIARQLFKRWMALHEPLSSTASNSLAPSRGASSIHAREPTPASGRDDADHHIAYTPGRGITTTTVCADRHGAVDPRVTDPSMASEGSTLGAGWRPRQRDVDREVAVTVLMWEEQERLRRRILKRAQGLTRRFATIEAVTRRPRERD